MKKITLTSSWMVLPPGNIAICRFPTDIIPDGHRKATATELLTANQGRPFPWGNLPSSERASNLWKKHRVGVGGLIHDRWFVTENGRFGGAPNVPEQLPGSLRRCMFLDGGSECTGILAENEGFAIIKKVDAATTKMYREVQMYAVEHVAADGGAIIVSPIGNDGIAHVGFVGRCQSCPNPELVSFRQLKKAVSNYHFELLDEWKNWSLA